MNVNNLGKHASLICTSNLGPYVEENVYVIHSINLGSTVWDLGDFKNKYLKSNSKNKVMLAILWNIFSP